MVTNVSVDDDVVGIIWAVEVEIGEGGNKLAARGFDFSPKSAADLCSGRRANRTNRKKEVSFFTL